MTHTARFIRFSLPFVLLLGSIPLILAQQGVGIGTTSPAASAILDISSTDQGLLIPRMTTDQRESIDPADEGLLVFDTELFSVFVYSDEQWQPIGAIWTKQGGGIYYPDWVAIGTAPDDDVMLKVATDGQQIGIELQNIGPSVYGIQFGILSSVLNNNQTIKYAGRFTSIGAGLKIGIAGIASGDTSMNIGLHGYAEGDSSLNRAAWFEKGDVVADQRMLIGSADTFDIPDQSAILELRSDSLGFLLPRMTAMQRIAISSPTTGLLVFDTDSSKVFMRNAAGWTPLSGGGGGNPGYWSADMVNGGITYNGKVGVGSTSTDPFAKLKVSGTGEAHAGRFDNQAISAFGNTTGIYATAANTSANNKTGGSFEALNGSGRKTGVYAFAFGNSGENIGLHIQAIGSAPINRAAWFDQGDVVIDEELLIGSSSVNDVPDESALLELRSTGKGLLLPRLTSDQRVGIASPVAGLIVYDTDSSKVFLRNSASWTPLGGGNGGGGTSGYWDASGNGIYYDGGNVSIGDVASPISTFYLTSDERIGQWIVNGYTSGLDKYGLLAQSTASGTGAKYGVYAEGAANNSDPSPAYGVFGRGIQNTSGADVYGVYGTVGGSGSGERWAGYFSGNTKVTETLFIGDHMSLAPQAFSSGSELILRDNDGTPTITMHGNQTTSQGAEILMTDEEGDVTLVMDSDYASHGGGGLMILRNDAEEDRVVIEAQETSTQGAAMYLYNADNVLSIELDADYGGTGDGRVITDELEIKGGSDLAEYFTSTESEETLLPGSVVVIDPDNPGHILVAHTAYDKKVVGVVSGANGIKPGMLMGQRESIAFGNTPVTIAGRVYVRTNDTSGKIEPGDLLTTSPVQGQAMKVRRRDKARGAILGKALTRPDAEGYVLILVLFQ